MAPDQEHKSANSDREPQKEFLFNLLVDYFYTTNSPDLPEEYKKLLQGFPIDDLVVVYKRINSEINSGQINIENRDVRNIQHYILLNIKPEDQEEFYSKTSQYKFIATRMIDLVISDKMKILGTYTKNNPDKALQLLKDLVIDTSGIVYGATVYGTPSREQVTAKILSHIPAEIRKQALIELAFSADFDPSKLNPDQKAAFNRLIADVYKEQTPHKFLGHDVTRQEIREFILQDIDIVIFVEQQHKKSPKTAENIERHLVFKALKNDRVVSPIGAKKPIIDIEGSIFRIREAFDEKDLNLVELFSKPEAEKDFVKLYKHNPQLAGNIVKNAQVDDKIRLLNLLDSPTRQEFLFNLLVDYVNTTDGAKELHPNYIHLIKNVAIDDLIQVKNRITEHALLFPHLKNRNLENYIINNLDDGVKDYFDATTATDYNFFIGNLFSFINTQAPQYSEEKDLGKLITYITIRQDYILQLLKDLAMNTSDNFVMRITDISLQRDYITSRILPHIPLELKKQALIEIAFSADFNPSKMDANQKDALNALIISIDKKETGLKKKDFDKDKVREFALKAITGTKDFIKLAQQKPEIVKNILKNASPDDKKKLIKQLFEAKTLDKCIDQINDHESTKIVFALEQEQSDKEAAKKLSKTKDFRKLQVNLESLSTDNPNALFDYIGQLQRLKSANMVKGTGFAEFVDKTVTQASDRLTKEFVQRVQDIDKNTKWFYDITCNSTSSKMLVEQMKQNPNLKLAAKIYFSRVGGELASLKNSLNATEDAKLGSDTRHYQQVLKDVLDSPNGKLLFISCAEKILDVINTIFEDKNFSYPKKCQVISTTLEPLVNSLKTSTIKADSYKKIATCLTKLKTVDESKFNEMLKNLSIDCLTELSKNIEKNITNDNLLTKIVVFKQIKLAEQQKAEAKPQKFSISDRFKRNTPTNFNDREPRPNPISSTPTIDGRHR